MSTSVGTLGEWRREFGELEVGPWPGPRPLSRHDPEHLLAGREDERAAFRREVDRHRLVFLSGSSGVGKTSLLQLGLVPDLQRAGFTVAVCREWSGSATEPDSSAFLARQVHRALEAEIPELPADASVFGYLNQTRPEQVVLVFDQFEELLRDTQSFKEDLFEDLIELNRYTSIKMVISLRSEFLHELRTLDNRARPFTISQFYLEEVPVDKAINVVNAGNAVAPGAIDADAATEVADVWREARAKQHVTLASTRVGLLHLQALLYVLFARSGHGTITKPILDAVRVEADKAPRRRGDALFVYALQEAVNVKLQRCRQAATTVGLDRYLMDGTDRALALSVKHLSSAGYKLVRDAKDLAENAIGSDLESLRRGLELSFGPTGEAPDGPLAALQYEALFDTVVGTILPSWDRGPTTTGTPAEPLDLLTAARTAFAKRADRDREPGDVPWAARIRGDVLTGTADPAEVTCGPMLGAAPAAVLMEELRRFAFAVEWMRASSLVRLSVPGTGDMTVALIHDGFGRALEIWAEGHSGGPGAALCALTAPRGAEFVWPSGGKQYLPELDGTDVSSTGDARLLVNLRWRGAWISTNLRRVAFVNCDLRGAFFNGCQFEGVTFVNCLLDGVIFSDCTVVGTPSPWMGRAKSGSKSAGKDWYEDPPQFMIAGSQEEAQLMARYGCDKASASSVLSPLPGIPAFPATDSRRATAAHHLLHHEDGGITVYGGRVSSLVVRSCRFATDGPSEFSLRDTAGSGFEVVEQHEEGAYSIVGSRLRHISFTGPVGPNAFGGRINLSISGSFITQLWIGQGLSGEMTAINCLLVSAFNGASPRLCAYADKCTYFGMVGFKVKEEVVPLVPGEPSRTLDDVDPKGDLMRRARGMDYRRDASSSSGEDRGEAV